MKSILYSILLYILVAVPAYAQDAGQNYILTRTMLNEDGSRFIEEIQYYDGLGRPSETVQKNATPSGSHLVSLQEYDAFGRESHSWLPVVSTADFLPVADFKTKAAHYYGSNERPYSTNAYENSPLNRLQKAYGPGTAWDDHPVATDYLINTASGELGCKNYTVSESGDLMDNGNYPAGKLYVLKSVDEDNRTSYVFTDMLGRQLLTRQMSDGIPHDTYFVYDDFGNRCFVLPPAYQSASDLPLYAYQYKFDGRNRCIEKKLPGCEPIYYVYDKSDRTVFSQDGVQRGRQEWTFYLYDAFGRVTVQGTCKNGNLAGISESLVTCTLAKDANGISPTGLGGSGYSSSFELVSPVVHLVNYYDHYDFLSLSVFSQTYGFTASQTDATGLLTGSIAAMLDNPSSRLCSAIYYDLKGRPVKEVSRNHLGGYEETVTSYTFTGKPSTVTRTHEAAGKATLRETYVYNYNDHAEQLINVTHQLNNNPAVTLSSTTYDDLGRLSTCTHHNNETLKSTYTYNIRNWISGISGTYFSQNLFYESGGAFNGNISSMSWKTGQGNTLRGYSFSYDGLNRLLGANYREGEVTSDHYNTSYSYDKMGNTKILRRNGLLYPPSTFGQIDYFTNTYVGNQLRSTISYVTEVPLYYGASSYGSTSKKFSFYSYDANGNLIKNTGKEISNIEYNSLDLPQSIWFEKGQNICYSYSADGVKRRRHYTVPITLPTLPLSSVMNVGEQQQVIERPVQPIIPPESTDQESMLDYCGNVVYEDGNLSRILVEDGYITFSNVTPVYHYYLQDHQGNIRVVMNQNATVEEVNHYYPFGGLFGEGIGTSKQPYKFSGKELDRVHGLDWYDFSARQYDGIGGRFPTTMDPLSEKHYNWSPYAYCAANPINLIDPTGTDWYRNSKGNYMWQEGHEEVEGYENIGSTVSIQMGDNSYLNFYQNGGIRANKAVDAFYLIQISFKLQNQFLNARSSLSEQSKAELFTGLVNRKTNEIGWFIGKDIVFPLLTSWLGGQILNGLSYTEGLSYQVNLQFTKSSLKTGQQMHSVYHAGEVGKEFILPSGKRIDFLDIKNCLIHEYKPFNPRSINAGHKQLEMYLKELQSEKVLQKYPNFKGTNWKTVLDTY